MSCAVDHYTSWMFSSKASPVYWFLSLFWGAKLDTLFQLQPRECWIKGNNGFVWSIGHGVDQYGISLYCWKGAKFSPLQLRKWRDFPVTENRRDFPLQHSDHCHDVLHLGGLSRSWLAQLTEVSHWDPGELSFVEIILFPRAGDNMLICLVAIYNTVLKTRDMRQK